MRLLIAILIIWLFIFYNIERLSKPVDITDVAYTFVPLMAVATILVPRLRKVPLPILLAAPIPVFLASKLWVKSSVWGQSLPMTVTEICAIALTTLLARWVGNGIHEFERAIARITIGKADQFPKSFSTGQADIYREVKRARHYQRPLALLAIGIEEQSIQVAIDRMVQEVQQAMMKQYVLSDVARVLCDKLEDYDILAQRDSYFLLLLPEVTPEQSAELVGRLHEIVCEDVGVTLQIGAASFPNDAVTFESLVERAVEGMKAKKEPERSTQPQSLATEHYTVSSTR
jgi:GGDEF domain-containing protein